MALGSIDVRRARGTMLELERGGVFPAPRACLKGAVTVRQTALTLLRSVTLSPPLVNQSIRMQESRTLPPQPLHLHGTNYCTRRPPPDQM